LLLIGSKEGLAHLCWAYVDPGDYTLVQDPAYTVPKVNTLLAGGTPYPMPLTAENKWLPDLSVIQTAVAKAAKILFLNYPHKPTGAVATREFFAEAVAFAREYDLLICHDCAYSEVSYDGYRAPSILQTPGAKDVAIELRSFSKRAGFTGVRCAFVVVPKAVTGDSAGKKVTLNSLWARRHTTKFNGASYVVQRGAAAAYSPEGLAQTMSQVAFYMENARLLREGLGAAGFTTFGGVHAPYIWLRTRDGASSWDFFDKLLDRAHVVGTPGAGFGPAGEGYFRLSAFNSRANVEEAIARIRKVF